MNVGQEGRWKSDRDVRLLPRAFVGSQRENVGLSLSGSDLHVKAM